jgi:hypothetical protein
MNEAENTEQVHDPLAGAMISSGDDMVPMEPESSDDAGGAEEPTEAAADTAEGSESKPEDSTPEAEETQAYEPGPFDSDQQRWIDEKIVAPVTARYKSQMERLQADLAQATEQIQQFQTSEPPGQAILAEDGGPVVPDPPDAFDSDYDQKMEAFKEAARARGAWEAQQSVIAKSQQEKIEAAQAELNKKAATYADRIKELGFSRAELETASETIMTAAAENDATQDRVVELLDMILEDDMGPVITDFLGKNPGHVSKMMGLSKTRAGAYFASEIRPKVNRIAGRRSGRRAPPPVSTDRGRGSPEQEGPPGVTYE